MWRSTPFAASPRHHLRARATTVPPHSSHASMLQASALALESGGANAAPTPTNYKHQVGQRLVIDDPRHTRRTFSCDASFVLTTSLHHAQVPHEDCEATDVLRDASVGQELMKTMPVSWRVCSVLDLLGLARYSRHSYSPRRYIMHRFRTEIAKPRTSYAMRVSTKNL
jgi:hypothetical protein